MKEQDLINKIKVYLNRIPNLFYWKAHGGIYGTAGIPDIIICHKGKFIGLECKAVGNKPTLLQNITLKKIESAGGVAQVVYTLEQVKEIIEKI